MAVGKISVTKAEYERLGAFRYALRQFLHFSEEAATNAGITPQQHQALLTIKAVPENGTITIGNLAERLQIRHHSAVGLVDRLVHEGLVSRERDVRDRRKVSLTLAVRGERVLAKLSAMHKEELRKIGPHLQALLEELS